ncbi:MAG: hypothetical protein ACPG7F_10885 [Aggregatilineales bacterium]
MHTSLRLRVIRTIWTAYSFALLLLSIVILATNIPANTTPGGAEIIMLAIVSGAAMISTIVVWTDGEGETATHEQSATAKAKRSQHDLDDMLDTLTDDQLDRLRRRLSIDEPEVMMLSDDGELRGQNHRS